jgi:flagellin
MVIIGSNNSSAMSARVLGESTQALQKSLGRLSSGSKLNSPMDNAAGAAISLKFDAQINRIQAAKDNVGNAMSFSQTQDGHLKKIGTALDRMSELAVLALDGYQITSADRALFEKEFDTLQAHITDLSGSKFNGVALFSASALKVTKDSDGATFDAAAVDVGGAGDDVAKAAVTTITLSRYYKSGKQHWTAVKALGITALAGHRATVGASMSRMEATSSNLSVLKDNISAANSRIKDVDVAEESANFARQNILVQSGTAMLAQANALPQSALRLIG